MWEIRRVQPQDIFSVIKIAYDTLSERYSPVLFNRFYETSPEGFLVAELHHKIVGFIIGFQTTPDIARITILSVTHPYRKKGVGTALIQSFLNEMMKLHIKHVDLEVNTQNTDAITFYEKHGFVVTDTIRGFYQSGDDACIMRRSL
jgi:ribosomal protein S18 acetylase RimI-like enzyme